MPDDFDLALRRMKTDLALLDLRRALLRDEPGRARSVLALTDRILELQRRGLKRRRVPPGPACESDRRDRSPAGSCILHRVDRSVLVDRNIVRMRGPTPRSLILDLLSTLRAGHDAGRRAASKPRRLFDLAPGTIRVALARLLAAGQRRARRARPLPPRRRAPRRCSPWCGAGAASRAAACRGTASWWAVHDTGDRSARSAGATPRARAAPARLPAPARPGSRVRPANLREGCAALRDELHALGLAPRALVFALRELDPESDARARALYDAPSAARRLPRHARRARGEQRAPRCALRGRRHARVVPGRRPRDPAPGAGPAAAAPRSSIRASATRWRARCATTTAAAAAAGPRCWRASTSRTGARPPTRASPTAPTGSSPASGGDPMASAAPAIVKADWRAALTREEIAPLLVQSDLRSWISIGVDWALVFAAFALVAAWPNPLTIVARALRDRRAPARPRGADARGRAPHAAARPPAERLGRQLALRLSGVERPHRRIAPTTSSTTRRPARARIRTSG